MSHVVGFDKVVRNLNSRMVSIKGATAGGLKEGALTIQRRSMELTPHDTGHLKGSAYTGKVEKIGQGQRIEIGYSAEYAIYVHEIDKNYKIGQWKFLETAMQQMANAVLKILRTSAANTLKDKLRGITG